MMTPDLAKAFGLSMEGLLSLASESYAYPNTVPGRVAHLDADFLAYIVTAEKKEEDGTKSLDACLDHLRDAIESFRLMAGAEKVMLHITPKGSTKGNRYNIALLKEYQGNRKDKPKPRHLHLVRDYMEKHMGAVAHYDCEADDGMAAAQYAAIARGEKDLSIIVTKDKDLRMVPGLHLDWDSGEIEDIDPVGYVTLKELKSGKKVHGGGALFFFAQLLRGDTADNISGLPVIHRDINNALYPTKGVTDALAVLRDPNSTEKKKIAAAKVINERSHKACGDTGAYELLKDVKTLPEAFRIVSTLFKYLEKTDTLKNYRDGQPITWLQALMSEAKLLWMRRVPDENDVVFFFRDNCQGA